MKKEIGHIVGDVYQHDFPSLLKSLVLKLGWLKQYLICFVFKWLLNFKCYWWFYAYFLTFQLITCFTKNDRRNYTESMWNYTLIKITFHAQDKKAIAIIASLPLASHRGAKLYIDLVRNRFWQWCKACLSILSVALSSSIFSLNTSLQASGELYFECHRFSCPCLCTTPAIATFHMSLTFSAYILNSEPLTFYSNLSPSLVLSLPPSPFFITWINHLLWALRW